MKLLPFLFTLVAATALAQTASKSSGTVKDDSLFLDTSPKPMIMISGSQILNINDKDGNLMVRIDNEGKVTYGKNYKPDDAAKLFWEVLSKEYFVVCKPIAEKK